jgi:hypothetical protein
MVLEGKEEKLLEFPFKFVKMGDIVYIFDKMIFRLTFVVILLVFLFVFIDNGGFSKHFFYSCPSANGACQNPFWVNCSHNAFYGCSDINLIPSEYRFLADKEFISAGTTIGERPGFLVNNFSLLFFLLLLNSFLFNHYTYNRSFSFKKFKEEVNK